MYHKIHKYLTLSGNERRRSQKLQNFIEIALFIPIIKILKLYCIVYISYTLNYHVKILKIKILNYYQLVIYFASIVVCRMEYHTPPNNIVCGSQI